MRNNLLTGLVSTLFVANATAQSLYVASNKHLDEAPLPFKWDVGLTTIYDDNVASANDKLKEGGLAYNPNLGLSVEQSSPLTKWSVAGVLGIIYYPDPPTLQGDKKPIDDLSNQSHINANLDHQFTERLRFTSNNMISREREPDYSYGMASGHSGKGEYVTLSTDDSLSFRWSKQIGTVSGVKLSNTQYPGADSKDNNRDNIGIHNQFRYQLSPQIVLTSAYNYSKSLSAGGQNAADSDDHYLTVGEEYRYSPTVIGIASAGAQFHSTTTGNSSTNPYVEGSLNAKVSKEINLRSFVRYSAESDSLNQNNVVFSEHRILRLGVTNEWAISPMFTVTNGLDYMPGTFMGGVIKGEAGAEDVPVSDRSETLVSSYVTLRMRFNDFLSGSLSYTYTNNASDLTDFLGRTQAYNRNRFSLGLSANF